MASATPPHNGRSAHSALRGSHQRARAFLRPGRRSAPPQVVPFCSALVVNFHSALDMCFWSALIWLLIGSFRGDLASLKLHLPDLLASPAWLTFGRIRPAHLNAMVYGWDSLAMLGVSCWLVR